MPEEAAPRREGESSVTQPAGAAEAVPVEAVPVEAAGAGDEALAAPDQPAALALQAVGSPAETTAAVAEPAETVVAVAEPAESAAIGSDGGGVTPPRANWWPVGLGRLVLGQGALSKPIITVVAIAALLVVGGMVGGIALYLNRDQGTTAAAGDCLAGDGIDPGSRKTHKVSLKTVSCAGASAKYKVVGRIEDKPESVAEAESELCDRFPGTQFIYWEGAAGENGTVLCLATNQAG
ncbi:MAG: hypothetical protein JXA67_08395 [Micromonosporaceae bacterium]|nr:hypothetical protein [Micromonosporaceae bacterium]